MSGNTFGKLFSVTTFGESHGEALGCIIDGCPPGLALSAGDLQPDLNRRKPGQSRYTTQRREDDEVEILSGVFDGVTTGTPIGMVVRNQDQKSKDYSKIKDLYRPAHADYTYDRKYGLRDYRGGGRSSARETTMRVAAGAVAKKWLSERYGVQIRGYLSALGPLAASQHDWELVEQNPFFCGDAKAAKSWESYLDKIRKAGSSTGAIIAIVANGIPAGLGQPLYGKLDAEIAAAMMSINAVKGVEIGGGFALSALDGAQAGDEMRMADGKVEFSSNHAGGILGGISSGQPVTARIAIKPTSSILTPRKSVDEAGNNVDVITKGRHDPCVGIRAVPVAEAMMACVLLDQLMRHHAQTGLLSSE